MEDLELVDYSSDHLEAQDVWGVPAGGLREVLEGFPRLGPEGTGTTGLGMERPVYDFSPSDFLAFSPPRLPPDEFEVFSGLKVDLIGSSSWKEAGDFFSRNLGFSVSTLEEGFEVVEGFDGVAEAGVARQVELACGEGGGVTVDWRGPLVLSEHRGCASPIVVVRLPKGAEEASIGVVENKKGNS